jgi:hypothetical protein
MNCSHIPDENSVEPFAPGLDVAEEPDLEDPAEVAATARANKGEPMWLHEWKNSGSVVVTTQGEEA